MESNYQWNSPSSSDDWKQEIFYKSFTHFKSSDCDYVYVPHSLSDNHSSICSLGPICSESFDDYFSTASAPASPGELLLHEQEIFYKSQHSNTWNPWEIRLAGSPGPWIESSLSSSHRLVKHLSLCYMFIKKKEREIEESIDQLINLTHLSIDYAQSLKCLPNSMANLHYLTHLEFRHCEALPENMEVLKMMTSLTLIECKVKFLPPTLSSLTYLHLISCTRLSSIPNLPNLETLKFGGRGSHFLLTKCLEQVRSLKHLFLMCLETLKSIPDTISNLVNLETLSIYDCSKLRSLPNSMANLPNLGSLSIQFCGYLMVLPNNLNVTYLNIYYSSIKSLPRGLANLRHLRVPVFNNSDGAFANLKYSTHLLSFSLKTTNMFHQAFTSFDKVLNDLKGLHELILLNIQCPEINYLNWSITGLTKLRFLLLPRRFSLETLPPHLNDSVVISIQGRHVRKTWKELKEEIGVSGIPIAQAQYPSDISPPGYLWLKEDLGQWINENYNSRMLVKILCLRVSSGFDVERTNNALEELSNLTHLYIYIDHRRSYTTIVLPQLSAKLANLTNLDLDLFGTNLPEDKDLPDSLRHLSIDLSIDYFSVKSLPHSIAKLSNITTLELFRCENLNSFPEDLKIVRLKLDEIINPLPVSVEHLEIFTYSRVYCKCTEFPGCGCLEQCLTRLVNLETLSITCYSDSMKSLPSIGILQKLRVLQLKDCFSLTQLPSDLDELIGLNNLDISGTRIKSLPDSIMKLSNLQRVILPRCFKKESLLRNLQGFITDDTDELYYKHMEYYDSRYESSPDTLYEGNNDSRYESSPDTLYEGNNDSLGSVSDQKTGLVMKESQQGVAGGLSSEHCAIPEVPESSQLNDRTDLSVNIQNSGCNSHTRFGQMSAATLENDEGITPFASSNGQSKNPQSDIEKGKTQKINISQEEIQQLMSKKIRLVDAAKELKVSRSTMKRRVKELGMKWPSSKKGKQNLDSKKRKRNSEPHLRRNLSKQKVNSSNTADIDNMREYETEANQLPLPNHQSYAFDNLTLDRAPENVKEIDMALQCHKDNDQSIEHHLDGPHKFTLSNNVQRDGSSNTFTVKATYDDDTVKFEFSLAYSLEQLSQEVGRRLKLEEGTFRIKYQDKDNDWIRMSCTSEFEQLLRLSRSNGLECVRLSIIDERPPNEAQKRRRASEENHKHLVLETKGEKCNEDSKNFFQKDLVPCILPFIERYSEVKDDGNCGFRSVAVFIYGDEEKWLDVRRDLKDELTFHKELYKRALGGEEGFEMACRIVDWYESPAPLEHWYEAMNLGCVVATKYQKVCTHWSKKSPTTFLPLETRLVNHPPTEYINMALVRGNHFIALHMSTCNIPLPRLSPLWEPHCNSGLKAWFLFQFKEQFDHYNRLCNLS